MQDIFQRLMTVIEARKSADPASSYTARLMHEGTEKIGKKILEEAFEASLAAKEEDNAHLVRELGDLFYHALVLAGHRGVSVAAIAAELERRFGTSGIAEKAARKHP